MSEEDDILKSLIAGGAIGAALGALLSLNNKEKGEGAVLGMIVGAVILSTFKANEKAKKMNLPVYVVENGKLMEILAGGEKRFIRYIERPTIQLPEHFKLK